MNLQKIKLAIKEFAYRHNYDIKTVDQFEVRNDLEMYNRLYGEEAVKERRFYNIGASFFRHEAWTNIDKESEWYELATKDNCHRISLDLLDLKAFPIESNSAKVIYTSHTMEHITNEAVQKTLSESYRVLVEGGILRIVVPDARVNFEAYKKRDCDQFNWINLLNLPHNMKKLGIRKPFNKTNLEEIFLWTIAGSVCEAINEDCEKLSMKEIKKAFKEMKLEDALDFFTSKCVLEIHKKRPEFHMNWFTEEKLKGMLKKAGFEVVYKSQYLQSKSPVLRNKYYFDQTLPEQSLYMEAKKEAEKE